MAIHTHATWGRTRRPKSILATEGTLTAGNAGSDKVDNTDPVGDKIEIISAVSTSLADGTITFTCDNSQGTDVFDGAGGTVVTQGFHHLVDNRDLTISSTVDGANQVVVRMPGDLTELQRRDVVQHVTAGGILRQHTTHGVRTENARYLHLYLDDTGNNSETVQVWGYNYAFGQWAVLHLPLALDKGDAQITTEDTDEGEMAAAVAAGTVSDAYATATFTVTSTPRMVTIPINGIDRVYFKIGTDRATVKIGAAISTF